MQIILLLEPTSPLRKVTTIRRAIKMLLSSKVDSLIPVSKQRKYMES